MATTYNKPALTVEKQVELLEGRGLRVGDRQYALRSLSRIGYYRLSGYWHIWKQPEDRFAADASFERAVWLYEYDRRLRLIAMDGIERVEILYRTVIAYTLAHAYGAFAHVDRSNFSDEKGDHARWLGKLNEEIGRSNEVFLEHYRKAYVGFPKVPIWMAIEVMSLGALSKLFMMMHKHDQALAVQHWRISPEVARRWLHTISYVRNVCAHHSRLWNREISIKPMIPRHRPEWRELNGGRVYAVLCILRELTAGAEGADHWADSVREHLAAMEPHRALLGAMGVPPDWLSSPFWSEDPATLAPPGDGPGRANPSSAPANQAKVQAG